MLNFFNLYAVIWGGILLLYSFGWSDLCKSIEPELLSFFLITISISLVLGRMNKKNFRFNKVEVLKKRTRIIPLLIVLYCAIEFVYCKQVPLISIVLGRNKYTDYAGIPTLHSIAMAYGTFYLQYLAYRYVTNKEKKALVDYCIIFFFINILQFNRGGAVISFYMSICIYLASNKRVQRMGTNKKAKIIVAVVAAVIMMFLFGVLGNIRHGAGWNNCDYIEKLGQFNNNYPFWLPKEFMWAYIYIVSPIANINYNFQIGSAVTNAGGYIASLIPDFIGRRILPNIVIYQPELIMKHVFNATAGFGTAYANLGVTGMYLLYIIMMGGLMIILKLIRIEKKYKIPMLSIMCSIVGFMFFTHTLYYSAISFPLLFPILSKFKLRIRT